LRRGLKDILIFKERKKGEWKQKTLKPWLHWIEKTADEISVSFGYKKAKYTSKNRFRTLLKRAYESNTLEKLKDFLSAEPQPVTG
jgi:hypothetical protein